MSRYGAVLAAAHVRRLLASSLLARMPLGMSSLAIVLLVRERTGSFALAGATVGVFSLSQAAAAPAQGALVDRLGARAVLLPAAAVQSALLCLLVAAAAAAPRAPVLLPIAALAGAFLPPVSACLRALWAAVLPAAEQRASVYSLDATTQEVVWTLGPVVVAAVASSLSPSAAVLTCAAVTLAGTAWFAASPPAARARRSAARRAGRGPLSSGALRIVVLSAALMGACIGALEVGIPSLALHAGSRGAAGAMLSVWSMSSMVGGLWYGARPRRRGAEAHYGPLLLAIAVSTAPMLAARSVAAGLALIALAGVWYAPTLACQMALVEATAPPESVTGAFTWCNAALAAGIAGGAALAGAVVDALGVAGPFAVGCAGALAAAAVALTGRGRYARPAPALPTESRGAD